MKNIHSCDMVGTVEKRRKYLTVEMSGIREKYGDGENKLYATSTSQCNCTFFCNHQAPCRLIILMREHEQLPIFEAAVFHVRYLKECEPESELCEAETILAEFEEVVAIPKKIRNENKTLDVREKYNLILPIALQIASLASNHGTTQFHSYLTALKNVESMVRAGEDFQCTSVQNTSASTCCATETPLPENDGESEVAHPSDNNIEENSRGRFQNLKFRTKLVSRGRPKRPKRQLCSFNRTAADKRKEPPPDSDSNPDSDLYSNPEPNPSPSPTPNPSANRNEYCGPTTRKRAKRL